MFYFDDGTFHILNIQINELKLLHDCMDEEFMIRFMFKWLKVNKTPLDNKHLLKLDALDRLLLL